MPPYMVHRTFREGLQIPIANGGSDICRTVVERNAEEGVSWVELPVDQITEVRVLDPYFYV